MKKLCALTLAILLIISMTACKKQAAQTPATQSSAMIDSTFFRLQSVTVEETVDDQTTSHTYNVTWTENGCQLDVMGTAVQASFNPETRVFSYTFTGDNYNLPVLGYDAAGQINRIFVREGEGYKDIAVTYDAEGYPVCDDPNVSVNKQDKTFMLPTKGAGYTDEEGNVFSTQYYEIFRIGDRGNPVSVREKVVDKENGKEIFQETVDSAIRFTYDQGGNLLSMEYGYRKITFTYSQEQIHHNWERSVALMFGDQDRLWYQYFPLFWNVK